MNSKIKGINIIKLKSNIDDRGFFREIIHFDDTYKFDKLINQVSHSHVKKKYSRVGMVINHNYKLIMLLKENYQFFFMMTEMTLKQTITSRYMK